MLIRLFPLLLFFLIGNQVIGADQNALSVDESPTKAKTPDDFFISWVEHIIDDPITSSEPFNGSDGLVMEDLDLDGFDDIVSVHESDATYDSAEHEPDFNVPPLGHVRVAFGTNDPKNWRNITLASGPDVAAPEDAAIGDINNDGFPDVIVAAELGHLIYFQNPTQGVRTKPWRSLILPTTKARGSYLRAFLADFNNDNQLEVVGTNKGAQRPGPQDLVKSTPVSIFKVGGDALRKESWSEQILGHYSIPQNAEPVDIDSDGDLDIIVGSRGERRIAWFENQGLHSGIFKEHAIGIAGALVSGFNMAYADINLDEKIDIIAASDQGLVWIQQPQNIDSAWIPHKIGAFDPDIITGIIAADINQDGRTDVFAGGYSRGSRVSEKTVSVHDPLGRLGWFENNGTENNWTRHDISRRKRGMFDKFLAKDLDSDGDIDVIGTRGNSQNLDGVFWLEQIRTKSLVRAFSPARSDDSESMPLP